MSQMQVGGGGHRSSQNVPMLKCPKWPRGGEGSENFGKMSQSLLSFFEGIPNRINRHLKLV